MEIDRRAVGAGIFDGSSHRREISRSEHRKNYRWDLSRLVSGRQEIAFTRQERDTFEIYFMRSRTEATRDA
jgi:hypothetical protein